MQWSRWAGDLLEWIDWFVDADVNILIVIVAEWWQYTPIHILQFSPKINGEAYFLNNLKLLVQWSRGVADLPE